MAFLMKESLIISKTAMRYGMRVILVKGSLKGLSRLNRLKVFLETLMIKKYVTNFPSNLFLIVNK